MCSCTENDIIKESVKIYLIPNEIPCIIHYVHKNPIRSIPYYFWTFRNFRLKSLHGKVYQNVVDACENCKLKYLVSIVSSI